MGEVVNLPENREEIWRKKLDAIGYYDDVPPGIPYEFLIDYIWKRWPEPLTEAEMAAVFKRMRERE
jgi:hypothetical protein